MIFRRKGSDGTAVAERPGDVTAAEAGASTEELFAEIEALTERNRAERDPALERRLLRLRHLAGMRVLGQDGGAGHPSPDFERLPAADGLPEIRPDQLRPELLRAGILRDGSMLVRGMIEREAALRFADQIELICSERDKHDEGVEPAAGYYEEFKPDSSFNAPLSRPWIKEGGGVLAADSPLLAFEMLEMFERAGITAVVRGYLGERIAISAQKTTLRRASPDVTGAWHQDGAFMKDVLALNVWVALSHCGDDAPGLDIVPKRLDHLVRSGDDDPSLTWPYLSYQVSQAGAENAAGDSPIVSPVFEPGDVLFFDEFCLHQTGSDPSMEKPRFAIESWFFAGSGFPAEYAPLAV